MSRLPALLVMLALLAPVPAAAAQTGGGGGGAFSPLPPAQPAETPTPEPEDAGSSGDVSRQTLILIGGGVIAIFFAIGWAITRDARRSLTEEDRAALEGQRASGSAPRKQDLAKIKERQRAKTRAQRQARKKTRRAGRR
jgi:hypothetical protein